MKKILYKTLVMLSLQLIVVSCVYNRFNNKSLETLKLNDYIDNKNVILLDKSVMNFNFYLDVNYKDIPEEERVKQFLNDYEKLLLSEKSDTLSSFVASFNFFIKDVELLSSNGFFTTTFSENLDSIIRVAQKWGFSVYFERTNYSIDSLVKNDSLKSFHFKNNRVGTDYYYGIHNIAKIDADSLTQNWVKAKIMTYETRASVGFIKTLPSKYLNSTLCKIMIFTEFILPYYNFEKEKFELPAPDYYVITK